VRASNENRVVTVLPVADGFKARKDLLVLVFKQACEDTRVEGALP
jgi:hypothetical protein